MIQISDQEFERLIGQALDELPEDYVRRLLQHAVVIWAEQPTDDQRHKLRLRDNQSLFGLYEGVPLTQRYQGGEPVLPDRITIFKGPITGYCSSPEQLVDQVKNTVWHEMAHFFGLDHDRIHELEQ